MLFSPSWRLFALLTAALAQRAAPQAHGAAGVSARPVKMAATATTTAAADAVCGDGVRAASEQCDDGNSDSGDGCSDTCAYEAGWLCYDAATPAESCDLTTARPSAPVGGLDECFTACGAVSLDDGSACSGDTQCGPCQPGCDYVFSPYPPGAAPSPAPSAPIYGCNPDDLVVEALATPRLRRPLHEVTEDQWARIVKAFWTLRTVDTLTGQELFGGAYFDFEYFVLRHSTTSTCLNEEHGAEMGFPGDPTGEPPIFSFWHGVQILEVESAPAPTPTLTPSPSPSPSPSPYPRP